MSESNAWDETRVTWKEWIKGCVVKMCSASLAGGRPHADYLAQLGMPRDRVFLGYDAVDNDYFSTKADESRKQNAETKKKLGLPDHYFLASARFVEKKNLTRLIQAYARYHELVGKEESGKQKSAIWKLVLLGDGPLKSDLCRLISDLNLNGHVQMPGFVQYPQLPAFYGLAGAFVHASTTEQWGLVVNEAMASGLPVLVSNRCGCAQDLVQDGVNGFTFDPENTGGLADLMLKISVSDFPLPAFGDASRRIIADWGPERFASGLKAAVDCALAAPHRKGTFLDRVLLGLLLRRRPPSEA